MLCSSITDLIFCDVKCSKCLDEIVNERKNETIRRILPDSVVRHWQDGMLLVHQFDFV
jgi:hypothetical protein